MKHRSVAIIGGVLMLGVLLSGCAGEATATPENYGQIAKEKFKLDATPLEIREVGNVFCDELRKGGDGQDIRLALSQQNKTIEIAPDVFDDFMLFTHDVLCSAAPLPETGQLADPDLKPGDITVPTEEPIEP